MEKERSIFSVPLSTVPLGVHDDGNRLQMSCNYFIQSLVLSNPELPLLSTIYLEYLTKNSMFLQLAKSDCNVIYSDKNVLIFTDENNITRIIRRPNSLWELTWENRIKKDEFLAKHWAVKYNRYCPGTNLNVVFAPYFGYNFEDGIVVSETGANKLTSRNVVELEFYVFPNEVVVEYVDEGKFVKRGELLFKLIEAPKNLTNVLCSGVNQVSFYSEFDCTINKITTYYKNQEILSLHKSSESFLKWVEKHSIYNEIKSVKNILKSIDPKLSKVTSLYYPENYEVVTNPEAIIIKIECLVIKKLKVGDKLGNRHGNKGVVALIEEDSKLRSKDGFLPDLVLNPLGVISRMNVGQIFEMHLSQILREKEKEIQNYFNYGDLDKIEQTLIDLEKSFGGKIPYLENKEFDQLIENGMTLELPLYMRNDNDFYYNLMKKYNISPTKTFEFLKGYPYEYGYGCQYWMALVHTVESKFSIRADGPYDSKTLLPTESVSIDSGQRLGEMEIWSLLAYDAVENIIEVLGAKADDISAKENIISHLIKMGLPPERAESFYTNHVLHLYMLFLNIPLENKIVSEEELCNLLSSAMKVDKKEIK